jgi:RNA polymerase sigma-70 factor (ECF subfamily)
VNTIERIETGLNRLDAQTSVTETEFDTAARECRSFLLQIAVASARNPTDAEDIVQEALMRGFRGIKRFRGECPIRVWLSRIVVRVAINHHRSLTRRLRRWVFFGDMGLVRDDGPGLEFDPPDHSWRAPREVLLDVQRQVKLLPDEFRMPLMMLAVDGLTIPEIAEILEIPPGTVKSRIFYGRKRLKDALSSRRKP